VVPESASYFELATNKNPGLANDSPIKVSSLRFPLQLMTTEIHCHDVYAQKWYVHFSIVLTSIA